MHEEQPGDRWSVEEELENLRLELDVAICLSCVSAIIAIAAIVKSFG